MIKAPSRPVVLVGMMGSGKTRIGRMLARAMHVPFVDTDDMVVGLAGMTIPEIFATHGEKTFRDHETAVIQELLQGQKRQIRVISTGGGAVMRPENAALIFGETISIWTYADIDVLLERVGRNNDRPLLQAPDPEKVLRDMAELRYPVYGRASIKVNSGRDDPDEAVQSIIRAINEDTSVK